MNYYDYLDRKAAGLTQMLTDSFAPYGYKVRREYIELIANNPIMEPVITVGMSSIVSDTGGFNCILGNDKTTGKPVNGKMLDVVYRVTVHTSAQFAYEVCRCAAAIITQACSHFTDVIKISSGESKYDRKCRCVVMPIDITVRYLMA